MTDKEFVKLLERLWPSEDPKEDERLLEESFHEEFKKFFGEEDEDE